MRNQDLFLTALRDALMMSEQIIKCFENKKTDTALSILENRSRVINIVFHLDEKVQASNEITSNQENQLVIDLIGAINEYDSIIQDYLVQEKIITQNEIAKTHKNKENFKGYNLNNTK